MGGRGLQPMPPPDSLYGINNRRRIQAQYALLVLAVRRSNPLVCSRVARENAGMDLDRDALDGEDTGVLADESVPPWEQPG
jgi:hypothetical protein